MQNAECIMQNVGRHCVSWIYTASQTFRLIIFYNLIDCVAYIIQNASAFSLIMHSTFYIVLSCGLEFIQLRKLSDL